MIRVKGLNRKFGNFDAVKDLNFAVGRGDVFGFIGSNGAGKTTTMRMLATLMKPTSGRILIDGIEMEPANYLKVKAKIGFMPQNTRLNENLEPDELIRFFCGLRNCGSKRYEDLFREIQGDIHKKVKHLSPGQQKKLQIVLAIIGSPDILILDEPTAGLDPVGVNELREIVRSLRSGGQTFFISSHNLKELDTLCNSIAIIHKGRILYTGEYNNVFEIETEEKLEDAFIRRLTDASGGKWKLNGNKIVVRMERRDVPGLIKSLVEMGIPVYGVKEQSLEVLYNDTLKGVG